MKPKDYVIKFTRFSEFPSASCMYRKQTAKLICVGFNPLAKKNSQSKTYR